jgi:hypothetical protein
MSGYSTGRGPIRPHDHTLHDHTLHDHTLHDHTPDQEVA